jgi:hypothetical protein
MRVGQMRSTPSDFIRMVLSLIAAQIGSLGSAHAQEAISCPTNVDELNQWRRNARDQYLKSPAAKYTLGSQYNDESSKDPILRKLLAEIQKCFGSSVPKCVQPLNTLVEARLGISTTSTSGEQQRLAQINGAPPESYDLPEILKKPDMKAGEFYVPNDLLARIKNEKISVPGSRVKKTRWELGWRFIRFKTGSTGGFDFGNSDTESLLLLYVPGQKFDRYIQIGAPRDAEQARLDPVSGVPLPKEDAYVNEKRDDTRLLPKSATMVTMVKNIDGKGSARPIFSNFNRTLSTSTFKGGPTNDVDSCISCHSNGVRTIGPLGYHFPSNGKMLPESDRKIIEEINHAMGRYGPMRDWGSIVDPKTGRKRINYSPEITGPPIGQEMVQGLTRNDAFLDKCSTSANNRSNDPFHNGEVRRFDRDPSAPPVRLDVLREAMNCADCHGGYRPPLNRAHSESNYVFKILVEKSMPPGYVDENGKDELTLNERLALISCLFAEEEKNYAIFVGGPTCEPSAKFPKASSGSPASPNVAPPPAALSPEAR